jgi:hypothetical protein
MRLLKEAANNARTLTALTVAVLCAAYFIDEMTRGQSEYDNPGYAQLVTVDIGNLPGVLPEAVKSQIDNSAQVLVGSTETIQRSDGSKVVVENSGQGSAVHIGQNLFLSAGHVFYNENSQHLSMPDACNLTEVDTISSQTESTSSQNLRTDMPSIDNRFHLSKEADSFGDDLFGSTEDVSLIQTRQSASQNNNSPSEPLSIINHRLKVGDNVYFINYEPTASGVFRDPIPEFLSQSQLKEGLSNPAVYGGVIIRVLSNGKYIAVDGIQGYSTPNDTYTRPGASGGGVYSENGKIAGVVVAEPLQYFFDRSDIDQAFNINLTGVNSKQDLNIVYIQGVTQQSLKSMQVKLSKAKTC